MECLNWVAENRLDLLLQKTWTNVLRLNTSLYNDNADYNLTSCLIVNYHL